MLTGSDALGRRILLATGGVGVLLGGCTGVFVGANGSAVMSSISVFGLLRLPTTPLAVGLYGATLAAVVLIGLFAAVEFVSRRERRSDLD